MVRCRTLSGCREKKWFIALWREVSLQPERDSGRDALPGTPQVRPCRLPFERPVLKGPGRASRPEPLSSEPPRQWLYGAATTTHPGSSLFAPGTVPLPRSGAVWVPSGTLFGRDAKNGSAQGWLERSRKAPPLHRVSDTEHRAPEQLRSLESCGATFAGSFAPFRGRGPLPQGPLPRDTP